MHLEQYLLKFAVQQTTKICWYFESLVEFRINEDYNLDL